MSGNGVLSIADAVALGELLSAAQRKARVAWWVGYGDGVLWGTARSVGDERGMFAGESDDVRDCYLWITTSGGMEVFWPISDLLPLLRQGLFVLDYQP